MIRKLREFQVGQVIRQDGPATHTKKAGTPTMGGLLILTAALVPTLLWADLTNVYIWIAVLATAAFGFVGFLDDYLKIVRHSHHGLWPRYKLGGQVLVAGAGRDLPARARRPQPLQHPADLPVLQARDPRPGLVLRALRDRRAGRRLERGEPHRRPRWPRDQLLCGGRGGLHRAGLRHGPPGVCRLPSDRALPAGGRAHGLLRRARRGEPRLPLVQLLPRRDLHGGRGVAGPGGRAGHGRDPESSRKSSC